MDTGDDDFFVAAFDQCFGFGDGGLDGFIARLFAQMVCAPDKNAGCV